MLFSCRVHLRMTWYSAILGRCTGYRPVRCHRKHCLWPYPFHVAFLDTHNALLARETKKPIHKLAINGCYNVLILWFIFWRHFDERCLHSWSISQYIVNNISMFNLYTIQFNILSIDKWLRTKDSERGAVHQLLWHLWRMQIEMRISNNYYIERYTNLGVILAAVG